MRNTPNREYGATLHEDPPNEISMKTGGVTARRSGVDPPPLSLIKEHGSAKQDHLRKEDGTAIKGKTSRLKPKMHPPKRRQGSYIGKAGTKGAKGKEQTMKSKPSWVNQQLEELFSSKGSIPSLGDQQEETDPKSPHMPGHNEETQVGASMEMEKQKGEWGNNAIPEDQDSEMDAAGKMKLVAADPDTSMGKVQNEWVITDQDHEEKELPTQEIRQQEHPEGGGKKRQRTILEYVTQQQKERQETQAKDTPVKIRGQDKQPQEEAQRRPEPSTEEPQGYETPEKTEPPKKKQQIQRNNHRRCCDKQKPTNKERATPI